MVAEIGVGVNGIVVVDIGSGVYQDIDVMKVFSSAGDNMGTRKQFFNSSNSSKDLPEFNIALLGALGVGKSGESHQHHHCHLRCRRHQHHHESFSKEVHITGISYQMRYS